jgi:hypothetical protein
MLLCEVARLLRYEARGSKAESYTWGVEIESFTAVAEWVGKLLYQTAMHDTPLYASDRGQYVTLSLPAWRARRSLTVERAPSRMPRHRSS